ncbi:hypothetical protein ACT17_28305 [Mycolicibacterium conceptionense]|uniref:Ribosylglycohydrolase n=1 Tax=Mycolicibacterium conceptionense TaxID=451644 RepID=A0A0J8WP83_9MYCO|nr:ADP-ribosylglycohydrolase family protein [Mycolicibacterium conceptionense]KMV14839.1 hypothetical protein ACT17_28305 [Mycolicibacterium conceptionense]
MSVRQTVSADRVAGALIGAAAGDALGAPYEFTHPAPDAVIEPKGGGAFGWEPGEWTDDTDLTCVVAQGLLDGDPFTAGGLDATVDGFRDWLASGPKDVGRQTKLAILHGGGTADSMIRFVESRADGNSGGNGSLMRTAPVALRYLNTEEAVVAGARRVSALTHPDADAGLPCEMWSYAIRHAILYGDFTGPRRFLDSHTGGDDRQRWTALLDEAETGEPRDDFRNNGWVVHALQTAWWAIATTPGEGEQHLTAALERCVRAGGDTDTTAAIAGALLGARWGASAVPDAWRAQLHGYPGLDADGLARLAIAVAEAGGTRVT